MSMPARSGRLLVVDDEVELMAALGDGGSPAAPGYGLVAHSDRGSQYASAHYQGLLGRHGIVCSMSRVAQCRDNAPVESIFASLKRELVHSERYTIRDEARASIFEYVEVFYNRVRRHSSLGYVSPDELERTHNPKHPQLRPQVSW